MYCEKCGKQLPEGANFCTGCGKKINILLAAKPKRGISKKIIALIMVVCISVVGGVGLILGRTDNVTVIGEYENGLILLQSKNKYGLMDYDGNIVEPCIYEEIVGLESIPQGKIEDRWVSLNTAKVKNEKDYVYESIGWVKSTRENEKIPVAEDRYLICGADDEIIRIEDAYGNIIRDDINVESNGNARIAYYGLIPIINSDEKEDIEYLIRVGRNKNFGVMNTDGEILVWSTNYIYYFLDGLTPIEQQVNDGTYKCGYANIEGKIVIPLEYDGADDFSEGFAAVAKRNEKGEYCDGYINTLGEIVIPLEYYIAREFSEGLAPVAKVDKNGNVKYGYIDTTGKVVIPFEYTDAYPFSEGLAAVAKYDINGRKKFGYINMEGKLILDYKYDSVGNFVNGFAIVEIYDEEAYRGGYINTKGEEITALEYINPQYFLEGLGLVAKGTWEDRLYGYIDTNGEEVIPIKYQNAGNFSKGIAKIERFNSIGNLVGGFIDKKGNEIIPAIYEYSWNNDNGIRLEDFEGNVYWCIHPFLNVDDTTVSIGELRLTEIDANGNYEKILNSKKELIVEINDEFMECAKYYKDAKKYYEKGKTEKALKKLEKALQIQPENTYLKEMKEKCL